MGTRRLLTLSALLAALLLASPAAFAHEGHHHGETEAAATWKCPSCGYASNTGNFCSKCGTAKPGTWTCNACGHRGNTGKFCSNCGTAKPDPNAPVAQASSAPADNGLCINVLRTNGSVDQYKLVNMPGITFSGNRISVGGVSYEKSKVQRLEYGKSSSGFNKTSDKPADQQNAVYFYRRDGKFNAFEQTAIKSMSHDIADTLQVALADSVYKIPIAAIDSIGIHPFPTVYNPRVVRLAPYIPYVESVSVENQNIKFKKNLPDEMKPKQGDILFYETFDTTFPDGFAGRVVTTDGYACSTEMVGIDDIYERVMMFGTLSAGDDASSSNASSILPALEIYDPVDPGMSLDLQGMSFSVSHGGVSASFKENVSPIFNVSTVKRSTDEKAVTVVSIGLSKSFEVAISVSGSASTRRYSGKSLSPMAKVVIPACPVFSVGLDIFPFVEASIKGKIGASGKASASFYTTLTYCDGDLSVEGVKFSADFAVGAPEAKAEGKLSAGVNIFPSVQMTGGILKLGPVFEIGPSLTATLKLDAAGVVNCAYDVIKDSKVTLSLEGEVSAGLSVLGKQLGSDSISFPFTLCERDWYFVPLFTKPTVAPTRKENVGVSTTASRDVLLSVPIGIDVLYGSTPIKYYDGGSYSGETMIIRNHFSGFEEGATYIAVPTLEIFGMHVRAFPTTEFTIDKEEEEPKPEVQDTPDTQDPPAEEVKQDTKDPSGYRFEWKDSNGDNGYFERKDGVYLNYTYTKNYDNGITYRYNDKEHTFAQKSDSDPRWWVEDEIYGSDDNVMEASREFYRSYIKGRQEAKEEANGLWNVFSDGLGGIAYFEETFRRHYNQTFGINKGEELLKKDYVGTGTICGIKCNIYDNHKRWPQQAKVWADPKTGLCLRYELDDGYWFEVTNFKISGYEF